MIPKKRKYLHSSVLSVRDKSHGVLAVRQSIGLHPLICVLSTLSGHALESHKLLEFDLKPLAVPAVLGAP